MIQMLREIINMFRKEKLYLFLFIAIIAFYLIFFLLAHGRLKQLKTVDPNKRRIEALLKEAPQNPQEIERKLKGHPYLRLIVEVCTLLFMSAFAYGVWLGTVDLKKLLNKEELIPSAHRNLNISWGISEVVKLLILFISVGITLNLVVIFMRLLLSVSIDSSKFILIHTVVLDLTGIFIMVWLVRKSGAQITDLIGFNLKQFPTEELWWGVRTYFLIVPIFIGILILLVYISNLLSYEPPPHPLVEVLLEDEKLSFWTVFSSLSVACVIGPIVEETFFRGLFYPAVRKYLGMKWTMIITAAMFAGVHENMFAFIPIFFLGLVLCYLYEKRSNLAACVSLHVIHNTVFIIYFFIMKSVLFTNHG